MDRVALRVNVDWRVGDEDQARHIDVRVQPEGAAFTARMQTFDNDERVTRSVQAPNCEQAVAAIALIVALSVEERLSQPAENAEPKRAQLRPLPIAPHVARPRLSGVVVPRAVPSERHHEFGAFAGADYGIGPGAAIGVGARWGTGRASFPLIRVAAGWHEYYSTPSAAPELESRFRLIAVTPEACAGQRLGWLAGTVGALCAGVELGHYRAQASTQDTSQYRVLSNSLFWASAELSAILRVASGALFVEVQPIVRFPLVSGYFSVERGTQGTVIYRIPRAAAGIAMGIGVSFW